MAFQEQPLVTVIMPLYNSEDYVRATIQSILGQTYSNFEFLIFNDGSTDSSGKIVNEFSDERIVFYDNQKNYGYVKHLNDGIELARGKYIARMDSDDISLPKRLETQVKFLEHNQEVGVCGTFASALRNNGDLYPIILPIQDQEIKCYFLIGNPIFHPSVMVRKSVLDQYNIKYNPAHMPIEDAYMWHEMGKVSKLHNIPEHLLIYRTHENQITNRMTDSAREKGAGFTLKYLKDYGFSLSNKQQNAFLKLRNFTAIEENVDYTTIIQTINYLVEANNKSAIFNKNDFDNYLITEWKKLVNSVKVYHPALIPKIFFKKLMINTPLSFKIRNITKCLLHLNR